jgi:hypothetical protein
MVSDLGNIARHNISRAQAIPRGVFGEIRVKRDGDALIAEMGINETPLTAFTGGAHIGVVAGAATRQRFAYIENSVAAVPLAFSLGP